MEQEDKLLEKVKNGDKEAFRDIVEKYKNLIYSICFNVSKNKADAENLAQETFLKVYTSLNSYKGNSFKNWMCKIAVNKSIDFKRRSQKVIYFNVNYEIEENIPSGINIEEEILIREDKKKLVNLLNKIPEKYSKILKRYYIYQKSYKEIAKEEKISIRTVESRIYRGRKELKKMWKEDDFNAL
ncbi:MAG: RNA polymerase sigma factor [Clostridiales bacterium]